MEPGIWHLIRGRNPHPYPIQREIPIRGGGASLSLTLPAGGSNGLRIRLPPNLVPLPPDAHIRHLALPAFLSALLDAGRAWKRRRTPDPPLLPQNAGEVLMVTHRLSRDGAPLSLMELALGLQERGLARPLILALGDGDLRHEARFRTLPLACHAAGPTHFPDRRSLEDWSESLAGQMRICGVTLVHANSLHSFPAVLAAHKAGLPCLWQIRESEPWWLALADWSPDVQQAALDCLHRTRHLGFVAQSTRRVWQPLAPQAQCRVVANALPPAPPPDPARRAHIRRELGLSEGDVMMLAVGTLCPRKGQADLLAALALARLPQYRLVLVGQAEPGYERILRQRAESGVHFLGPQKDPSPYYQAADLFLCAARFESAPRTLLEARSYGLPILTSPVFGIPEMLPEGQGALYFPPGDSAALARLLTALQDPQARADLAAKAPPLPNFQDLLSAYAAWYGDILKAGV